MIALLRDADAPSAHGRRRAHARLAPARSPSTVSPRTMFDAFDDAVARTAARERRRWSRVVVPDVTSAPSADRRERREPARADGASTSRSSSSTTARPTTRRRAPRRDRAMPRLRVPRASPHGGVAAARNAGVAACAAATSRSTTPTTTRCRAASRVRRRSSRSDRSSASSIMNGRHARAGGRRRSRGAVGPSPEVTQTLRRSRRSASRKCSAGTSASSRA